MSESVLAVGEVPPPSPPAALLCLFAQRVDQLSICELLTQEPLVSGLGLPQTGFKGIRLLLYRGPFSWESRKTLQGCSELAPGLWEVGHPTWAGQLLACLAPPSSSPLRNHAP